MTRMTYFTAATLDGYLADEDDSLAWLFAQQERDRSHPLAYDAFIARIGAIVMGRTTYEWILRHHMPVAEAWPYDVPTWVLTHADLPSVEGADIRFTAGDVRAVHAEMVRAAAGRDLWVVGGGDLAGQFADAGLLDEVLAQLAPVTLGAGRPLLPRRLALRLAELKRNGDFVITRYAVVGPGRWGPADAGD